MEFIRDIRITARAPLEPSTIHRLRARIRRVSASRERIFCQVVDPTGHIQVVIHRINQPMSEELPTAGERWEFSGTLDTTTYKERTGSVIVSLVATEARKVAFGERPRQKLEPDEYENMVRRGLVLARFRHNAADILTNLGYVEIEPRLVALSSQKTGLEAIEARYVGFGAPAHLIPSPAGELRAILTATEVDAVFAISRVFSTTYRDEKTSYEALTAMAMRVLPGPPQALPAETSSLTTCIARLAEFTWLRGQEGPPLLSVNVPFRQATFRDSPKPLIKEVDEITTECYTTFRSFPPEESDHPIESFQRVVAPPRTVLGERSLMRWYGDSTLELTTVHLERFTALIPDVELRLLHRS